MMRSDRKLALFLLIVFSFSEAKVAGFGVGSSTTFPRWSSSSSSRSRKLGGSSRVTSHVWRLESSFLREFDGDEYRIETKPYGPHTAVKVSDHNLGFLVLMTVPITWGTYVPVVRYLYEIQPPVPGLVFSACFYVLASLTLLALAWRPSNVQKSSTTTTPWPWQAGMELGSYLVIANALQMLALKTVPSDRAGFLMQLTSVMVPLVVATLARDWRSIPNRTWAACLVAFSGVIIMSSDGGGTGVADLSFSGNILAWLCDILQSLSHGDLLVVASAFLYTLHVVRLGHYAKTTTPLKLAASKSTIEAILSVALVTFLVAMGDNSYGDGLGGFASDAGLEISSFLTSFPAGIASGTIPPSALYTALGAVAWTGWISCAYTIYAQSYGQQRVNPTDANLVYSAQPLFTALFAWLLLGETMGPCGAVGGALIGLAVYLVASTQTPDEDAMPVAK